MLNFFFEFRCAGNGLQGVWESNEVESGEFKGLVSVPGCFVAGRSNALAVRRLYPA